MHLEWSLPRCYLLMLGRGHELQDEARPFAQRVYKARPIFSNLFLVNTGRDRKLSVPTCVYSTTILTVLIAVALVNTK